MSILHPESPDDYVATALSVEQLLEELKPTLVVVDNLMDAARDAVVKKKQAHVILSPNTLKDFALADQELRAFTYPL